MFEALNREFRPRFELAWPRVPANLGWMSMGIVDTMMVGRVGPEAIRAVSLGGTLFITVGLFGGGLLLGLDTLVPQAFGAGRVGDCHRSLLNSFYVGLALSPNLMGIVWLLIPFPALRWLPGGGHRRAERRRRHAYAHAQSRARLLATGASSSTTYTDSKGQASVHSALTHSLLT
jgi:Na+-driven multidrug efflux pump